MNALLVVWFALAAPDTLHLEQAYAEAVTHDPLKSQIELQERMTALRLTNWNVKYLPELSVSAQAGYQSEALAIPISLPNVSVPSPDKDSYQLTLNANQLIYDFGVIGKQKEIEKAQQRYEQKSVESALNQLKGQVNNAFFAVLLLQEKERSLALTENDIQSKLNNVRSRVKNGTMLASNRDILEAELLRVAQSKAETRTQKKAALDDLGVLLDRPLSSDAVLVLPEPHTSLAPVSVRKRLEYDVFDLSKARLTKQMDLVGSRNRPRISAFLQLSYARPGLNAFARDFHSYYVAGVKATWNLWTWNTDRRDQAVVRLQQDLVTSQEEKFTRQVTIAADRSRNEIDKLDDLIRLDGEIITLRQAITRQMSSQLDNGVIMSSEYLTELNAEHQARLTLQTHKIQLIQAQVDYLTTIGE